MLAGIDDPAHAERAVTGLIDERTSWHAGFRSVGSNLVARNANLLVYSQSQRVLQVLHGVPNAVQRTVHVYVAECRPKSPRPYQDAAAICEALADTQYAVTVCPDVVALNLLATQQIDRVLMGAHALYDDPEDEGNIHSFVNTCGSGALVESAMLHGVPVSVVGEPNKVELVPASDASDQLDPRQEARLA